MDKYKTLASNTIVLALGQFGSKLLVILLMRFYQGCLGEDGYGTVGNIVDASTLLMAIVTLSIGESVIRFGLDKGYDNTQVFSIAFRVTSVGMIVCLLFVPFAGALFGWFPENEAVQCLHNNAWLIYVYVFTGSFKSCCALFVRSIGYVRLYAIDGIFTTVMNILFNMLFLLAFNLGVFGYVLSVILADVCSIIFISFMANLKRYFQLFGLDRRVFRAMLAFCIPMIPTSVMWWVTNVSDSFFVTGMISIGAAGIYKAAYKLPSIIAILSGIFSQAWNMSAITENNSRTVARFYSNVFNIYQSFIFVIAAGMLLLIKPAIVIVCQPSFQIAYVYTPFLIFSVVFTCFSTFMGSVYVASKKSVRSMVTACVGAVLNIVLNLILIPAFGLQGAAFATFISYLVIFIARAVDTRGIVYMNLRIPKLTANFVLIFAMGLIVMLVTNELIFYLSLSILFLFVVVINFKSVIEAINVILRKKKLQ